MTDEKLAPVVLDRDPVPDELQDGEVVIEAGAYEGAWAKKVCEQREGCKVYAFEPATRAYDIAEEALKGYPNVTLCCVALGKRSGTVELCDCNRDAANTFAYNPEDEPSETVVMFDVAEILEPLGEIGLMHLNAEGGEIDIIERLVETGLIKRVKMLLVQWHRWNVQPEMAARVRAATKRLAETHEPENRAFWKCWKRNLL